MSEYKTETEMMIKAARWTIRAARQIELAGGVAAVLDLFSDDLINTMVRNGLEIVHVRSS